MKRTHTFFLLIVSVLLAFISTGCSTSLDHVPVLTDKGPETTTEKDITRTAETPAATTTGISDQFGVFTGSFNVYPPFKISYDKRIWEYRSPDGQNGKPPFRLVARSLPTCFFDTNIFTEGNFEPAEYINLDGRIFRSLRQDMTLMTSDKTFKRIGYQFTYPGTENIENTPTPHGRYGNHWKFALVASADEMPDCYKLALDLLQGFEADLKTEPTLPADPNALLIFSIGNDTKQNIAFGYAASDWMEINETGNRAILVSRQMNECSFEGYLQGTVPETKDWEQFYIDHEKIFLKHENNNYRPDTRIILYIPTLKGWWFEVYTPFESYDKCLGQVKEVLKEIQLTPIIP